MKASPVLLDIVIGLVALAVWCWAFKRQGGWCGFGLHRWDSPGGHCEECGACDEFFGKHNH
jgi:hypothetical protein